MRVEQIWRFPVKSLRGESLESATLTEDGIKGDRLIHVRGTRALSRRAPGTGY